jgi:ribonuclease BN (tRNA processing enzyme)
MTNGITVRVLGDYGPFSRMGKSIGYLVTLGNSQYLLDCGTPLFQQIGGHGLKNIKGLIITHCHDDHKRWFSDLALFNMYAPDFATKLFLLTSEQVNDGLKRASGPALERSLSLDGTSVVDISYESYVEHKLFGPRAKYRITKTEKANGETGLHVEGPDKRPVGPERAKIIISSATGLPRLLFRDPEVGEWVEPDSYYDFSSDTFYEEDKNVYIDPEGFTIEAFNAPVWHGLPSIGLKFSSGKESLLFSSDTVHDIDLWKQLTFERRPLRHNLAKEVFESSSVLYGDINDFIERSWSRERYEQALHAYDSGIVVHDIAAKKSIVHTDYSRLNNTVLRKEKVILTHSPDLITSEWVLSRTDKLFRVIAENFFEVVGEDLYPLNADIYHKEAGRYYVGYKNPEGDFAVCEKEGMLSLSRDGGNGKVLFRVDLFEDIGGRYFPILERDDDIYFERKDGLVERIRFSEKGSSGEIVVCQRNRLSKRSC